MAEKWNYPLGIISVLNGLFYSYLALVFYGLSALNPSRPVGAVIFSFALLIAGLTSLFVFSYNSFKGRRWAKIISGVLFVLNLLFIAYILWLRDFYQQF